MEKLLTIAIPTYNRAKYLEELLNSIYIQIEPYKDKIELIVSDNASVDNTETIVKNYISKGLDILYIKNNENIGPDMNFIQCFKIAKGNYFHLCGDDDIFTDLAFNKIFRIFENKREYGLIYLNCYGFNENHIQEMPKKNYKYYYECSTKEIVKRVNYYFTFISGNIINKKIVNKNIDFETFCNTNLVQLSWILPAVFNTNIHVYIEDKIIAAKAENSGGYKLFKVFGTNMNNIFNYFKKTGVDKEYFDIINRKLILYFFPMIIYNMSKKGSMTWDSEDIYEELKKNYDSNILFWIFLFPLIKGNKLIRELTIVGIKIFYKIRILIQRIYRTINIRKYKL